MTIKARVHALRAAQIVFAFACLGALGCSNDTKGPELSTDEVKRLCTHASTCPYSSYTGMGWDMTRCFDELQKTWLSNLGYIDQSDVLDCSIAAGSDCDQNYRCRNEGHDIEACDEASFEDRCDGNMLVRCLASEVLYTDCTRFNNLIDPVCFVDPQEGAMCTSPCSEPSTECRGDFLEGCILMEEVLTRISYDCSLRGQRCETVDGVAACVGQTCTSDRCDGDVVVICSGNETTMTIDCAEAFGSDFTCGEGSEGGLNCIPRGTQCDPEDYDDTCDGTSVIFCRAGYIDRVDCLSFGYSSCVQGEISAHCQ